MGYEGILRNVASSRALLFLSFHDFGTLILGLYFKAQIEPARRKKDR